MILPIKYDVGDFVLIKVPQIKAQVTAITYNGFVVLYHLVYWEDKTHTLYEAYDFELEEIE